jgi:hypothetical protein
MNPEELATAAAQTDAGHELRARTECRVATVVARGEWFGEEAVMVAVASADPVEAATMGIAALEELPEVEREKIATYSFRRTFARCLAAAEEMCVGLSSLGPEFDIDPEAVAVLAAGPACGKAASPATGTIQ